MLVCLSLLWLSLSPLSLAQQAKGKKYALLVGIKEYYNSNFTTLAYTENDVEKLAPLLKAKAGFDEIRLLTTSRGSKTKADAPTAANIRKALADLLAKRTKHDTILIAFSGHGV